MATPRHASAPAAAPRAAHCRGASAVAALRVWRALARRLRRRRCQAGDGARLLRPPAATAAPAPA
eukprot:7171465-Pyramimonas_sp.AAC.1